MLTFGWDLGGRCLGSCQTASALGSSFCRSADESVPSRTLGSSCRRICFCNSCTPPSIRLFNRHPLKLNSGHLRGPDQWDLRACTAHFAASTGDARSMLASKLAKLVGAAVVRAGSADMMQSSGKGCISGGNCL